MKVTVTDDQGGVLGCWQGNAASVPEALRRAEGSWLIDKEYVFLPQFSEQNELKDVTMVMADDLERARYWDDPSPSQNWKDGGAVT